MRDDLEGLKLDRLRGILYGNKRYSLVEQVAVIPPAELAEIINAL